MDFGDVLAWFKQRGRARALIGRSPALMNWLESQTDTPWVSTWEPNSRAHNGEVPKPGAFRGLQAVVEIRDPGGSRGWELFWTSKRAADVSAVRVAKEFHLTYSGGHSVYWIELMPLSRWRRLAPWGVFAAIVASVATVLTNLDGINSSLVKMAHRPEMTLETTGKLQIDSSSFDHKDVVILGDPFIRSTLSNVRMSLIPVATVRDGNARARSKEMRLETADHSVGASEHFSLPLPFDRVAPGQYMMTLSGRVRSSWPWNYGRFTARIPLDARSPLVVRGQISELNPESPRGGRADRAYVDLAFVTGQLLEKSVAVRVDIPGAWMAWTVTDESPMVNAVERLSQNTRADPKDVVFIVRFSRLGRFSTQSIRLSLQSPVPMSSQAWARSMTSVIGDPIE